MLSETPLPLISVSLPSVLSPWLYLLFIQPSSSWSSSFFFTVLINLQVSSSPCCCTTSSYFIQTSDQSSDLFSWMPHIGSSILIQKSHKTLLNRGQIYGVQPSVPLSIHKLASFPIPCNSHANFHLFPHWEISLQLWTPSASTSKPSKLPISVPALCFLLPSQRKRSPLPISTLPVSFMTKTYSLGYSRIVSTYSTPLAFPQQRIKFKSLQCFKNKYFDPTSLPTHSLPFSLFHFTAKLPAHYLHSPPAHSFLGLLSSDCCCNLIATTLGHNTNDLPLGNSNGLFLVMFDLQVAFDGGDHSFPKSSLFLWLLW